MSCKWMFSARSAALSALLAGAALAAQARGQWSLELGLGWPVFPAYPAYPAYPAIGAGAIALPGAAVSVQFGGVNYWHHRGVWYRPWGPRWVVVAPPVGIVVPIAAASAEPPPAPLAALPAAPSRPAPVVYPRNGQDAQQTEADRQACDRWATTQPAALADATVFMRAVEACMDGRGYTMN